MSSYVIGLIIMSSHLTGQIKALDPRSRTLTLVTLVQPYALVLLLSLLVFVLSLLSNEPLLSIIQFKFAAVFKLKLYGQFLVVPCQTNRPSPRRGTYSCLHSVAGGPTRRRKILGSQTLAYTHPGFLLSLLQAACAQLT